MLDTIIDDVLRLFDLQRIGAAADMATTTTTTMSKTGAASSWWTGSLLPFIPKPLKALFLLLILLNLKSFPTVWHLRLWGIAYASRIQANWMKPPGYYRYMGVGVGRAFRKRLEGEEANGNGERDSKLEGNGESAGHEANSAVAIKTKPYEFFSRYEYPANARFGHRMEDPLAVRSTRKSKAAFDDCDYNLHLSNSSYAKNLDYARMQACIDLFSPLFAPKAWMALGAAHYDYVKEIEWGREYEIRFGIGGWEGKWIYFIAEFVTYPNRKKSKSGTPPIPAASTSTATGDVAPSISESKPSSNGTNGTSVPPGPKPKKLEIRADGSVLHCFSVSTYCFKLGRITIPPAVVLSFCGYGDPSNWERAQRLLALPDKGKAWLQGGWKDEPEPVGAEWDPESTSGGGGSDVAERFATGKKYGVMLKEALEGLRINADKVEKTS